MFFTRSVFVSIRNGLVIAVAAIGILAVGWASPAAAQGAGCTGGGRISKQVAKQMSAAQDALKAKKWQDTLAKTREAEVAPGSKSQFDLFMMSEFRGYAYTNLKEYPEAARELEAGLNSPCMPEAKKLERYKGLAAIYSSLRNYPKVIDYGNRALKVTRDPEMQVQVAQAYFQSGNNKDAARVMNELLEQKTGVPKEQQLLLVLAACQRANDNACVSKVYEKLVVNYPKTEYWQNLMDALRKGDTDDIQKLNVMRLAVHVNVMKHAEEYKEMAQLTLDEKLSCEAQTVLEQGFSKKAFTEQRDIDVNTRLLTKAKTSCAAEKAVVGETQAMARAAPTGNGFVKLGAQYLGFGDPSKAADALQQGISKGGIGKCDPKDPNCLPKKEPERVDEAGLLLGIAHLRNNNKVEAKKAFNSVKQDPTMVRIAKLWLLNT